MHLAFQQSLEPVHTVQSEGDCIIELDHSKVSRNAQRSACDIFAYS